MLYSAEAEARRRCRGFLGEIRVTDQDLLTVTAASPANSSNSSMRSDFEPTVEEIGSVSQKLGDILECALANGWMDNQNLKHQFGINANGAAVISRMFPEWNSKFEQIKKENARRAKTRKPIAIPIH